MSGTQPTPRRNGRGVVAAVVAAGLALTALATLAVRADEHRDRVSRFEAAAGDLRQRVEQRIDTLETSVAEQRNALVATWPVSASQFAVIADLADAAGVREGVRTTSFARFVPTTETATYEASVRAASADAATDALTFTVHPAVSSRPWRVVVEYLAPVVGNEQAFGFDLASDPIRRAVVEEARDRGTAVATAPIRLVQAETSGPSILLVAALYETGEIPATGPSRRRHFVGVLSTAVVVGDLLEGVLPADLPYTTEIYDLGPTNERPNATSDLDDVLLDSDGDPAMAPGRDVEGLHASLDIDVGGRRWRLAVAPTDAFTVGEGVLRWVVAVGGIVLSLLLGALIASVTGARRRAEQLVAVRTAGLQSLVARAPDATVVVDGSGTIVLASNRVESLLGYRADELIGQPVEILVPAALRERHRDHRAGFTERRENRAMGEGLVLSAVHRNGHDVPVEVTLSSLPEGETIGRVIASMRDVSLQRQAAEQLLAANEQKSAFLGTVSHELRTPLTAIRGFTQILLDPRRDLDDETRTEFLRRIERNTVGLNGLIEELLLFSRLERHGFTITPSPMRLDHLVGQIVGQLGPVSADHLVQMHLDEVVASVDVQAVTRIVTNLLTNATRYSPVGTTVAVTTRSVDGRAEIVIDDEGPGIPAEQRHLVFDRFWRGSATAGVPGTGIGLAVVAELVELLHGRVSVTGSPAGGARFVVSFAAEADGAIGPTPAGSDDELVELPTD